MAPSEFVTPIYVSLARIILDANLMVPSAAIIVVERLLKSRNNRTHSSSIPKKHVRGDFPSSCTQKRDNQLSVSPRFLSIVLCFLAANTAQLIGSSFAALRPTKKSSPSPKPYEHPHPPQWVIIPVKLVVWRMNSVIPPSRERSVTTGFADARPG